MKCKFCNADAIGVFQLESFDGHKIEYSLCIEDALLLQAQGYSVHFMKREKKVEGND
jgi:hypothetical protein